MAEDWKKFILKQDNIKRKELLDIIDLIACGETAGLDIVPLVGHSGYFRCRVGKMRIVFEQKTASTRIDSIGYRGDIYKTY